MNLNSTVRLTSDGTVHRVDLTYDVQETDIVQVYFDDEEIFLGWTLQRNTTPQRVEFESNIPAGTLVLIRRYTDMRDIPHVFHYTGNARGGAEFNAKNLDDNFDKIKRAAQDAMDSFELIGINLEAAADARASADAARLSAVQASNYEYNANQRANAAQSSATAAVGSATAASNHADRAEAAYDDVAASASAAVSAAVQAGNSETAAGLSAAGAEQAKQAAQSSASAASNSAGTASTQASNAASSASEASGYANTAGTQANLAAGSAAEADTHRSNAAGSAAAAASSEALAQKWATNPEDQAVETGQYSAKHWALKAEQMVVTAEDVITNDTSEIKFTGTGRALSPLEATVGSVNWSKVTGKPSSYVGDWNTLLNKPSTYATTWALVAAKPTSFPSSWSQVSDKPALASATHTHTWADILSKPSSYPTTWSDVGSKPSTFPPTLGTTSTTAKRGNWYPTWLEVTGKPVVIQIPTSESEQVIDDVSDVVSTPTGNNIVTTSTSIRALNGFLRVSLQTAVHLWAATDTDRALNITVGYRASSTSTWINVPMRCVGVWAVGDGTSKPMSANIVITGLNPATSYFVRLVYSPTGYASSYSIHGRQLTVSAI